MQHAHSHARINALSDAEITARARQILTVAAHVAGCAVALTTALTGPGGALVRVTVAASTEDSEYQRSGTGFTVGEAITALLGVLAADEAANDCDGDNDTDPTPTALRSDDAFTRDDGPTIDELARDPEWQDFCDAHAPTDADVDGLYAQMHPRAPVVPVVRVTVAAREVAA